MINGETLDQVLTGIVCWLADLHTNVLPSAAQVAFHNRQAALKRIQELNIKDRSMKINAEKLREMLHELKEILGSVLNASEEKMADATAKIEAIFEQTPAPVIAGEVKSEPQYPLEVAISVAEGVENAVYGVNATTDGA